MAPSGRTPDVFSIYVWECLRVDGRLGYHLRPNLPGFHESAHQGFHGLVRLEKQVQYRFP